MGIEFRGSYAEVIKSDKLAEIVPEAWCGVLKLLREDVKEPEQFLTVMAYLWLVDDYGIDKIDPNWLKPNSALFNEKDGVNNRVAEYDWAFDKLGNDFAEATKVGESTMDLDMGYNCDSDGVQYDSELVGPYFCVLGCYEPTPAAKALVDNKTIERRWGIPMLMQTTTGRTTGPGA